MQHGLCSQHQKADWEWSMSPGTDGQSDRNPQPIGLDYMNEISTLKGQFAVSSTALPKADCRGLNVCLPGTPAI